ARLGLPVDLRAQGRGGELRIRWENPEQEAALFQYLGVSLDDDESGYSALDGLHRRV
ncbi:chromosome partitioning protein ParB, partial [Acidithiobacillus sp. MC2.1]|nr:chromosome partitioning protein ParB [Acidithiobacillus sp. MC2.2]